MKGVAQRERDEMTLQDQPSYIIRMRAKPGAGDKLFELAATGMVKSGASDRFIILRITKLVSERTALIPILAS